MARSPVSRPPGRVYSGANSGATLGVILIVGLGAWVWASGELAGKLFRGRWPAVNPMQIPGVLARLPARLGSPRQAWPPAARTDLPGGATLVVLGAAMLAVLVVVMVAVWRLATALQGGPRQRVRPSAGWPRPTGTRPTGTRRGPHSPQSRQSPTGARRGRQNRRGATGARWAAGRDLVRLRVRGPASGRLVVGVAGRRRVATEARHSVLVVGPTQSGKTTGLAIPALLEWEGPVLATSVKDDLAVATLAWRSAHGRVWVFDPTRTSGLGSGSGWSPLAGAGDWSSAQRMAGWLVESTPARSGLSEAAFWYAAAAKQLAPLLLAAHRGALTMAEVVRWNNLSDFEEPAELLDAAGERDAAVALAACAARDERIRSSVATTLETVLAPFEDPVVAATTACSDIEPQRLLGGANSLYLCGPSYEQARVQGLFASLVAAVVAEAVAEVNRTGRPLDPPLLVVLDEAANIAPLRDLDTLASTGAGLGVQLVTVVQDLSQLTSRYGPDRARTIANNHRAKLVLSGVADLTTLDLLSGLVGDAAMREETVTADLRDGRRTCSTAIVFRRLAPTDELRRIPPGQGILIYGHLPPVRLRLRPWYDDRRLRARAQPVGGSGR